MQKVISLLRGMAWVRVSKNGACITLGKAHTDRACEHLRSYMRGESEPHIIPVRGPVLKELHWCERCLSGTRDDEPNAAA